MTTETVADVVEWMRRRTDIVDYEIADYADRITVAHEREVARLTEALRLFIGDVQVQDWSETSDEEVQATALKWCEKYHDNRRRAETAEAEMARLRVDAGRYAWLREHFRFANDSLHEIWFDASLEPNDSGVPADLDQVIDALATQEGK